MKNEILIALIGISGVISGALIQSSTQFIQFKSSKKEKHEIFVRTSLDNYIPFVKSVLSKLEKMDSSGYISIEKNKKIEEEIISDIEEISKIEIELFSNYPLDIRDKLPYVFNITKKILFYTRSLTDEDTIEMNIDMGIKGEIDTFTSISDYHINNFENTIKKKFL